MINVHKNKPVEKNKIFAVLTGDIVGSSRLSSDERIIMLSVLKSSFSEINKLLNLDCNEFPLEIFRGDSFQVVLSKPENALFSTLYLRSAIRKTFNFNKRKTIDARIAIGLGSISFFPSERSSEGDGEAFRNSGISLDKMKKNRKLIIQSPWQEIDDELNTSFLLLDNIIFNWSSKQAEAVYQRLQGNTQEQIAEILSIKQASVNERLEMSGYLAIEKLNSRYSKIIEKYVTQNEL